MLMLLIVAAIIAVAAVGITIYLLSPMSISSLTTGGTKQEPDKSETMQDFQRWQTVEKCVNAPSTECDKQMITIAQACQSESSRDDVSCTSDKLASYLDKRGLAPQK